MAATFRTDLVAAVMAILNAQITATPTQLRIAYVARPGSFPETPCAYIGDRSESITYPGGQLRTRTMVGFSVVLVDTLIDASETMDRLDPLVDLLVDRFTAAYAQVAGGNNILQLGSVSDTELTTTGPNGSVTHRAVVLSFADTFITEGRT